jgi:hypothetical protein
LKHLHEPNNKKTRIHMATEPSPVDPGSSIGAVDSQKSAHELAVLVAEMYETAPAVERRQLLDLLLPPMGVLALVSVANGVFARIRLRTDWAQGHVRLEDAERVRSGDVAALVERLALSSLDAIDGLARWATVSPIIAGSSAAAVMLALLYQRNKASRSGDRVFP